MNDSPHLSIEECPLKTSTPCQKRPRTFKGPLRVVRLCILGIFLPSLLIAIPLYMRYHVYGHQLYPLAMSDMRLLDNKVSTTWCQRQLLNVNTTFNAFLLENSPKFASQLKPLTMVRHLTLEDDTKEYWGFYLLQGSSVTVSTCVRWPGASLIVIRGHKHLHECAYIGDNSSEELDELMEAIREQTYVEPRKKTNNETDDAPVNDPDLMKRHRVDVEFHHPFHQKNAKNYTLQQAVDDSDITDPKILKTILESLQNKTRKKIKQSESVEDLEKNHMHVHRNSTVAKNETKNLKIEPPHPNLTKSQEAYDDIIKRLESLGNKSNRILDQINKKFSNNIDKGKNDDNEQKFDVKGRHYSKPSVNFDDNIDNARRRRRREIIISNAMQVNLTQDDDEHDLGLEEGFTPDGIADHRGVFNETTLNDYSNSEFWSSFSSSEEALLNCAGLILNLPLTPHHKCSSDLTEEQAEETYLANTITYKVPINGYYFFVFNSENEVQPNYIRVQFHLKKSVYNVSNPVSTCLNSSETCAMNLKFFSSEKVVMELPVRENSTLWNEEFVVVSECEPRTAIYVICVIAVPVLVILFAFS